MYELEILLSGGARKLIRTTVAQPIIRSSHGSLVAYPDESSEVCYAAGQWLGYTAKRINEGEGG
jgi:hypothetical protein